MAANSSGYVIECMFLHYPRVIGFQKYFKIFFSSYRLCAVACTKIIDQVLVAANGSGYVIENIILQHLMITRIQKFFFFFYFIRFLRGGQQKKRRAVLPGSKWRE